VLFLCIEFSEKWHYYCTQTKPTLYPRLVYFKFTAPFKLFRLNIKKTSSTPKEMKPLNESKSTVAVFSTDSYVAYIHFKENKEGIHSIDVR